MQILKIVLLDSYLIFSKIKGGKKAMNKMETRIRELQSEMDAV